MPQLLVPQPISTRFATVGGSAPELSGALVTGTGPASVAEAKGRVLIVDFFPVDCEPCKLSFHKYQQLVDELGGGFAVIGVNVDEPGDATNAALKQLAGKVGAKFPILADPLHETATTYKPIDLPTSFIIDKAGNVRHLHAYRGKDIDGVAAEVRALLAE